MRGVPPLIGSWLENDAICCSRCGSVKRLNNVDTSVISAAAKMETDTIMLRCVCTELIPSLGSCIMISHHRLRVLTLVTHRLMCLVLALELVMGEREKERERDGRKKYQTCIHRDRWAVGGGRLGCGVCFGFEARKKEREKLTIKQLTWYSRNATTQTMKQTRSQTCPEVAMEKFVWQLCVDAVSGREVEKWSVHW